MARQITVKCIDHVALKSARPEETARFYIDLLGLHAIDESSVEGAYKSQQISIGWESSTLVTITHVAGGPEGELGIGTVHHAALTVESPDALLKWKRWLQGNEILVYGPYDQHTYQDIIFMDPDGVLLEIATRGPGWDATQNVQEVYLPPKESMAPYRDEERIRMRTWPHPVTQIEPDMALQGFHHIATIVSSLEETDHFYREDLGLALVGKTLDPDDPEVEQWYWGLDGGQPGTLITGFPIVHADEGGKPIYGQAGVGVVDHFAMKTDVDEGAPPDGSSPLADRGPDAPPNLTDHDTPISLQSPDGLVVELVTSI